jgi:hypothetical protein
MLAARKDWLPARTGCPQGLEYAAPTGLCSSPSGWERMPKAGEGFCFLVVVLQICRADGAGDERRAKIILRWTFGAFGV